MSARRVFRALRTPITLILLIGVLAGGAVWGYHLVVTGVRPVQPSPCVMVAMPELTPESVVIRVYNGGSTRGLANSVAKELRGLGYIVSAVGNTDEIISQTIIVGFSADSPEVQLVASQFLQPGIRVDGRIDHTVDVLIGDDIPRNSAPL
ncbi:MAG: LytR C-terminal domain-containing protein, partial [Propionibacteriaceae bacterium]|nr:LytR C-terminal domain-containing protein [Propionibacteriaceae bacterium]